MPVVVFQVRGGRAELGVSNSLLILQSKQANVMCITLAVSLKVSAPLLISPAAFWGHSDAGDFLGCWGNKTRSPNKDSIYKGCKTKTLITFELECGSLLRGYKIPARSAKERAGPGLGGRGVTVPGAIHRPFRERGSLPPGQAPAKVAQDRTPPKIQAVEGQGKNTPLKVSLRIAFFFPTKWHLSLKIFDSSFLQAERMSHMYTSLNSRKNQARKKIICGHRELTDTQLKKKKAA